MVKKKVVKNHSKGKKHKEKSQKEKPPTLNLKTEHDIAMDFALKIYKQFDKVIKSVVLFGSAAKHTMTSGSDIDIIIILDDVSVNWDQELIAWYREELDKIIRANPYSSDLHINTVKLSTWWEDLLRGDPVVINILRYGETMVDMAGFFEPQKRLLIEGKIRSTPEAIYSALNRAPLHLGRSKAAELGAIDGIYWCMVDSSHAALIASGALPASPEHIAADLKEIFVNSGKLKDKYVQWYKEIVVLYKKIAHGEIRDLKGVQIDDLQAKAEEFLNIMAKLTKEIVESKYNIK
jgi:predicted nucleotidyltransferase/uncharacterized protein (UPF0332 family)